MTRGILMTGPFVVCAALAVGCAQSAPSQADGTGGQVVPGTGGRGSGGAGGSLPASGGVGGIFFPSGGIGGTFPPGTGGEGPLIDGPGRFVSPSSPVLDGVVTATTPPPTISGGTLLVLADGATAVAADPDRDQVYVVDVGGAGVTATVALNPGDEPGRLVQDGAGLVHVVLRGAGAVATIDPKAGTLTMRRDACATARGIAYDAAGDRLYVACASGELMVFSPQGATPSQTWSLAQDLRDVVVDGDSLLVTRFRSAEVLVVDPATGTTTEVMQPPSFSNSAVHGGTSYDPAVAWRAVPARDGGLVMVHQRGMNGTVQVSAGGYGGPSPCDSIVHTAVCHMKRGTKPAAGPAMPGFVLPVDIALSSDGLQMAIVAAGNGHAPAGTARRLFTANLADVTSEWSGGCGLDDKHGPSPRPACVFGGAGGATEDGVSGAGGRTFGGSAGASTPFVNSSGGAIGTPGQGGSGEPMSGAGGLSGAGGFGGATDPGRAENCGFDITSRGEPIAVAYASNGRLLVQLREPAQLVILPSSQDGLGGEQSVSLSSESRADTGHVLFHANSGGGLACASCHPEGHEDGRVWDFAGEGPRRTQDPSGGLLSTAPFHWNGDMPDFATLATKVFVGRMSGPPLSSEQTRALQGWVDDLPELPPLRSAADPAVVRGKAIFESAAALCSSCHSGPKLTSNATVSVGTGDLFQVPSLHGVGWRAPYMHDGCAPALADRFTDATCGGGDQHGMTSQLSPADQTDLIAYLQSL